MSGRRISGDAVNRLYLFLFFVVGALAAQMSLRELSILRQEQVPKALVFMAPLVTAALLSGSAAGVILIPVSSLCLGAVCGITAEELILWLSSETLTLIKTMLTLILSVSVFFTVSVRGMQLSSLICAYLERQKNPVGVRYVRSLAVMTTAVLLLGALIVCLS